MPHDVAANWKKNSEIYFPLWLNASARKNKHDNEMMNSQYSLQITCEPNKKKNKKNPVELAHWRLNID